MVYTSYTPTPDDPSYNEDYHSYKKGVKSTKSARAEYSQAGANPVSNPNSLPHVHGKGQMAHRVPLAAEGCPVDEENLHPISANADCKPLEDISSSIHSDCMKALQ